jgi:hypothetical protein
MIELARAERLHPVWPEDVAEQGYLVRDRADRAADEAILISYKHDNASIERLRHRLRQTIAMAIRAYIHTEEGKND